MDILPHTSEVSSSQQYHALRKAVRIKRRIVGYLVWRYPGKKDLLEEVTGRVMRHELLRKYSPRVILTIDDTLRNHPKCAELAYRVIRMMGKVLKRKEKGV